MSRVITLAAMITCLCAGVANAELNYKTFATCAGRLSAEVASAWVMRSPHADRAEEIRDHLAEIAVALTPKDAEVDAMSHRIQAKVAHAELLSVANFGADLDRRTDAAARAEALSAQCAALILGPEEAPNALFPGNTLPTKRAFFTQPHN